jgi:hypothetical protein
MRKKDPILEDLDETAQDDFDKELNELIAKN